MSGKNLQEGISLGDYTAQLRNCENLFRAFPIETMELESLNNSEVIA
jgi:hypothetical protein